MIIRALACTRVFACARSQTVNVELRLSAGEEQYIELGVLGECARAANIYRSDYLQFD